LALGLVAVMVTVPVLPPNEAWPGVTVDMVMTALLLEVKVVVLVTSVPPSVASSWIVPPTGKEARLKVVPLGDVTVKVCVPTLTLAVPEMPFFVAVMVTALDVLATPVTTPLLLTVACATSELLHVELPVSSAVLPSSKVPVAVKEVV